MEQGFVQRAQERFLEAVCQPNSFIEILQAAWQLLHWPVFVGDDKGNVIALIPDEPIGSVSYDRLLTERRVNPNMYIPFQEVMRKVYNPDNMEIQYIPGEDDQYPCQAFLTIRAWSEIVAHIVLHLPKEEPTEEEKTVVELLQKVLCAESRKMHQQGSLSGRIANYQLRALLEHENDEKARIQYAEGLQRYLRGSYRLIVSLLEEEERQEAFPAFYMEEFSRLVPDSISVAIRGNVVTLCGEIISGREGNLEKLYTFARHCAVRVGVSRQFEATDLPGLQVVYQQALLTVRLGARTRTEQSRFLYEDLEPLQVFVPVLEGYQTETFLHDITRQVMAYDRQNNTEYLKTLRAYLVTGRNNKESVRLLAVHQNTLLYRLTKMKELFGIDFQDGVQSLSLLCNVLLLEVARPDLLPLFDNP